jgi:hypothetical protein
VDAFGVSAIHIVRTKTPERTAKSCGPGAATLASSLRSDLQVTVAKEPAHRGEHEVSRKAIAQGMSDCLRCPVCSCAPFFCAVCTRDRGCSVHPAFPAPLCFERGNEFGKARANHAARSRPVPYLHVVPAKAGTHTPRRTLLEKIGRWLCLNNNRLWLWVPAFAGTTADVSTRASPTSAVSAPGGGDRRPADTPPANDARSRATR